MDLRYERFETVSQLRNVRDVAMEHIRRIEKTQKSNEPWLPGVANVVSISLEMFIDECNERLDRMKVERLDLPYKSVVQMAFEFLYEHTSDEKETSV